MELQRILVIDDEPALRHMLRLVLEKEGCQISEAANGIEGLALLEGQGFDAVFCDLRMPEMDGVGFLREAVRRQRPETLIMMSAYGTIDLAIECMKAGAYDYISKPFKPDEVVLTLRKAEERQRLRRENSRLREALSGRNNDRPLIFVSKAMQQVMALVDRAASATVPVLLRGETGTGKELVARALHERGDRREKPFVAINCSAIPAGLIESELFGHVRGAFSGADRDRQGLFAAADGGTLFLDEIGELPLELQPKLLRVLQEGELRRVGETRAKKIDVRVVAATIRNLEEEARAGQFRDDLYYRLAVLEIVLPPLRERPDDIPLLVKHFLSRHARHSRRPVPQLTTGALAALQGHAWPGNVRELENFLEKTLLFCSRNTIEVSDLPGLDSPDAAAENADLALPPAIQLLERDHIRRALLVTGGNRTRAAHLLGISLRGLLYKLKEYGLMERVGQK